MTDSTARVALQYPDPRVADAIAKALAGDDDAFCQTRLDGSSVVATLRGSGARSLLRSVDDLLASVSVAEDVMKTGSIGRQNA